MNSIINLIRPLTLNKIAIFLFTIIYCGFYYEQYQSLIAVSYVVLCGAFVLCTTKYKSFVHIDFIIYVLIFVLFNFLSVLWAKNPDYSYHNAILLTKSSLIAVLYISLLRDRSDLYCALFSIAIAGLVYASIYFLNVDFSSLGAERITSVTDEESFPNVNIISMILAFSFIFFIYYFLLRKNIVSLILAIIAGIAIILLGSRKSILMMAIAVIMMAFKGNAKTFVVISGLCILILFLLPFFLPLDYLSFVKERFDLSGGQPIDDSDMTRLHLIKSAFRYWSNSPIVGHGLYSFCDLYYADAYTRVYSHNNFLEILVGTGIIGFLLYYLLYNKMYRKIAFLNKMKGYTDAFLIIVLLVVLLFNQLFIVVLLDKYTWLFLSIIFAYSSLISNKVYEIRFSS